MDLIVKDLLFALLGRAVWDTPLTAQMKQHLTDDMAKDFPTLLPAVYALAKKHDMAHLVSVGLGGEGCLTQWQNFAEGTPQKSLYDKLYKQESVAVYRYESQRHGLDMLCRTLAEEKIPHMPLKGAVMNSKYPRPWMRTGCDIDLLVRREDMDKACACLTKTLGYQPRKGDLHTHDRGFVSPTGVVVELHFSLNEPLWKAYDILDDVWSYATEDKENPYRYAMPQEIFYFYHLVHMAKHISGGGCGIRPFLDLWLMGEMPTECARLCEENGLLTFALCAIHLANVWFGDGEHTSVSRDLENYILDGGMYGSLDNRVKTQPPTSFWRKVFLPYEQLTYRYPVLQKHKWLTPVFEVARWFAILFGGGLKRRSKEMSARHAAQGENPNHLLDDLGLTV